MKPTFLENFKELREQNIISIKSAKDRGSKAVGLYCTYCPRELVLAAGAIPIGLCGTKEEPIAAAERDLPRNLCPLIKSSYGFGVSDSCPYFHFSDLVIGETTCDGKKKMFELMQKFKPMHVMNLPQIADLPHAKTMWFEELKRLQIRLEETLEVTITEDALREAIHTTNEENRALQALFDLNKAKPALVSGTDMLMASWQIGFHVDRKESTAMIDRLVAEIQAMAGEGYCVGNDTTPRILLTGTPVGLGSEKVITLVEESGGLVVAMENCGGYKTVELRIDERSTEDPLLLLADKYLKIPCSVMSPNTGRLELLERMIKEFRIDAVIDLTWQACHTYNVESYHVAKLVQDKLGLPFIQLETDYSNSDSETLRVRIEALLEMI
ncbi:MAG: double-cubane-cluster-containing anaerobic reductase [Ignavibacteriales bacterium]